jgi:hypothetical protein
MILRGATSLRVALEGVGPENQTFLGPEMARAKRVPFGPATAAETHNQEWQIFAIFI